MLRGLLFLFALVCGCNQGGGTAGTGGSTLQDILEKKEIVVGIELGFFPFEFLADDGSYQGFDIDLAREFATDMEVAVRFEPMKWTALMAALKTKQIDLIWSGMTATVSRSKSILFSDTYFRTRLCLLVRADSDIKKPEDMKGKKLVVKMGTTGESVAEKTFPDSELLKLPNENNCAQEVAGGGADAFLYDTFSILRHHERQKGATRVIPVESTFEPYAVAMRRGDYELWRTLNLFLEKARWDGRYKAIHEKHFGAPPDDTR